MKSICFCTSRLAARLPARITALGKTCRVSNTVSLFHFLFYGFPNSKVRALLSSARTPHRPPSPPPDADADADADEAVTDALFFHSFCLLPFCPRPFQVHGAEFFTLFACCCLFARALFRYKVLSDERKAVARLERCFERCPRPASTLRCPKYERLVY